MDGRPGGEGGQSEAGRGGSRGGGEEGNKTRRDDDDEDDDLSSISGSEDEGEEEDGEEDDGRGEGRRRGAGAISSVGPKVFFLLPRTKQLFSVWRALLSGVPVEAALPHLPLLATVAASIRDSL